MPYNNQPMKEAWTNKQTDKQSSETVEITYSRWRKREREMNSERRRRREVESVSKDSVELMVEFIEGSEGEIMVVDDIGGENRVDEVLGGDVMIIQVRRRVKTGGCGKRGVGGSELVCTSQPCPSRWGFVEHRPQPGLVGPQLVGLGHLSWCPNGHPPA